jgi:hypothetical protein
LNKMNGTGTKFKTGLAFQRLGGQVLAGTLPKLSVLGKAARSGTRRREAAIRVAVRGFGLKKRPTLLPLIRPDFA